MFKQQIIQERFLTKRKIILASSSKRRKKILSDAGMKFKAVKTNFNEENFIQGMQKIKPEVLVKLLALNKVISVIENYKKLKGNEIIIGFDTIIFRKNKIIGKPKNKKDALEILLFLSNKKHMVYTGIAIVDLKKLHRLNLKPGLACEITEVKMKRILKEEAMDYVNTREPLDKAGAYAIQGKGRNFIRSIKGDYFNVIGLPLNRFLILLKAYC